MKERDGAEDTQTDGLDTGLLLVIKCDFDSGTQD